MLLSNKSIFITGGAGTLGREIIKRSVRDNWNSKITIYSTDPVKHARVKREFPFVHCVIGDIRDPDTVYNAMAGHDVVIHAAAVKEIPFGEHFSIDTFRINVEGSMNIASAALHHGVKAVMAISTDKSCHPANAYGSTKYLMEKVWQEYARVPSQTNFLLVRYGNVLESTASVIEVWKKCIERGEPIKITNPNMTRFWLSPSQAVDVIEDAMRVLQSGEIFVPKMGALSIGKLAEYTLADNFQIERIAMRAGEKMHETLLTCEETEFVDDDGEYFVIRPTTTERNPDGEVINIYTSQHAPELSKDELMELLKNE